MRFGLDSTTMVPESVHHSVGSTFAVRYVSRYTPKAITREEARRTLLSGISLAVVFEDGADNALGGYARGKADGEFALKQATDAGMPKGRPIYAAVDFDAQGDGRLPDLLPYFEGYKAVLGDAAGVYGGVGTCEFLNHHGIKWGWQTLAWSGGRVYPLAKLYQYDADRKVSGYDVDFNHAFEADFGQWDYKPSIHPSPGYNRFTPGELGLVMTYDHLRKHGVLNRKKLAPVRLELQRAALAIVRNAGRDGVRHHLPHGLWTPYDRVWRFWQLRDRSKGHRFV